MINNRSLARYIIFTFITLGIYGLYWIYKLAKDVNAMCEGDGKKTAGLLKLILLSLVTFGIYSFIWYYMLGDRIQDNAPRYNLEFKENGGTILLWYLLGSFIVVGPFIAVFIIIKNTNAMAEAYNEKLSSSVA